jgi:hypothetical protein
MNREDIIRMAREAGFEIGSVTNAIYAPTSCETELERFAVIVAAAEREACAKTVEDDGLAYSFSSITYGRYLAEQIRARGNA